MKDSFILYLSQYEAIKEMTDEQLGKLFRALCEKQLGNEVVLDDDIKIAFNFINNQMVVDNKKYEEKVAKLTANAKKGGAPKGNKNAKKQPNNQNNQIESVNVNDNVNVNVNDNVVVVDDNKVMSFYLNNINSTPVAKEVEVIESYEKELPQEVIIYAMEKAVENKVRNLAYIKGILNKWLSKGITTLAEAKDERKPPPETTLSNKFVDDINVVQYKDYYANL